MRAARVFLLGLGLLLLVVLIISWRQRRSRSDDDRPVAGKAHYAPVEDFPAADPQLLPPAYGVVPRQDRMAADVQKSGQMFSKASASASSPDSNKSRANGGADGEAAPKIAKVAAQESAGVVLTPADILSQKLDLNDPVKRAEVVRQLKEIEEARKKDAWERATKMGIATHGVTSNGGRFELQYFEDGKPVYHATQNANAAISTATNQVRSTVPFNVTGANVTIGLWEAGGIPRLTHQEFSSRITVRDGSMTVTAHANHVAGTLGAAGINLLIKGMAPNALIDAYSSTSDVSKMVNAGASALGQAGKLYISNHSYGLNLGWTFSSSAGYTWNGKFTDNSNSADDIEDDFGRYSSTAASYDGLCFNLPYYLPVFSAGNERNDGPPSTGTNWTELATGIVRSYNPSQHPVGNGVYKSGYDTGGGKAVTKNLLIVGAVTDAVGSGSRSITSATLSLFSSTGPTDDGRIKPDVVANGDHLLSTGILSDTDTLDNSGTSMAAPNVTGSAALLIDYYGTRFTGQAMRASTLKGLIIHAADDMGNPGPDYQYGWGLMNTKAAADLIKRYADNVAKAGDREIIEGSLTTTKTSDNYSFQWNGTDPIRVTLCWTDPAGTATTAHDDRTRKLVNDLNVAITGPTGSSYLPYIMPYVGDWTAAKLSANATTGVNTVDNVEQVYIASPGAHGVYTVTVSHAGSLTNGAQNYSLIVSGQLDSIPGNLANNTAVTGLTGALGGQQFFRITVPAGQGQLVIGSSGGTGDVDLYIRHGALPTLTAWDFRPFQIGNNESVTIINPAAGDWYIMLNAFAAYSGVALSAQYGTAPVITAQPVPVITLVGSTAGLSVAATGSPTPTYQWRKDGESLSGATNAVLSLTNVQAGNAGSYTVVVSNSLGSVTSNSASLAVGTVLSNPVGAPSGSGSLLSADQFLAARFTVATSSKIVAATGEFSNSSGSFFVAIVPLLSDSALPVGTPAPGIPFNAGEVVALATFSLPQGFSGIYTVPLNFDAAPGVYGIVFGSGLFGASGTGGMPRFESVSGSSRFFWSESPYRWQNGGTFQQKIGIVVLNGPAVAPIIVTQPAGQWVSPGGTAALSVVAAGTQPLTYQWRKSGTAVSGATNATFVLSNAQAADAGSYSVVVSNSGGNVTSNSSVLSVVTPTILANNTPVGSLSGPTGTQRFFRFVVPAGQTRMLISTGGGSGDVDLYVRFGALPTLVTYDFRSFLAGNSETVTVEDPAVGDWYVMLNGFAAYFDVILTAQYEVAPMITTQPTNRTVTVGQAATFTVAASGTPAPSYQWQRQPNGTAGFVNLANNATYSGVVTSVLTVSAATLAMSGDQFRCVASNGIPPDATSTSVTLTITKATQTIAFSTPADRIYGASSFTVTATASSGLPVTFSVVSGPATLNGSTVSVTGSGVVTLRASQVGDASFNAAPTVDRSFTVATAPLTVTADNKSRTYGAANPGFSVSYAGFVNNETVAVLTTVPSASTTATVTSNAGTYAITPGGGAAANYVFTYGNGTLTITKAPLTAKADDKTKVAGAANPVLTGIYTGFVNGENSSVIDIAPTISTTATLSSPAGTYPITLTGGSDNNYALTLQSGTLTVTAPATPEIEVEGKGVVIVSGDFTPTVADDTDFAGAAVGGAGVKHTFTLKNTGTAALNLTGNPRVGLSGPYAADFVVTQPVTSSVVAGGQITFDVTFVPSAAGTRTAVVSISSNDSDEGLSTFAVQGTGVVASATQSVFGRGYAAGGTVTITNTFAYSGAATGLAWQVMLPTAWSFLSDGGSVGGGRPVVGATSLLEWAWTTLPASPVTFTYTLSIPAGSTGEKELTALVTVAQSGVSTPLVAQPDPLKVRSAADQHSADTTPVDGKINLVELTRVIELYNTRNGTLRTGRYAVAITATEDGFSPDAATPNTATVTLARYHSADPNHDGRFNLTELTRVIELYNYRSGTTRTGQYRVQAGSEDGFAPGP